MKTIYLAQENADLTEGRGPMVTKAAFTYKNDAETFAQSLSGVMGIGQGEVKEMTVYENVHEHPDWRGERLRAYALSKLTSEERQALGL